MNFDLYLFGKSHEIHEQIPTAKYSKLFQKFTKIQITSSQLTILQRAANIYYTYSRKLSKNNGNYFGICLIFTEKAFCKDLEKLYRLFDAVYDDVIIKNGILLKEINGQIAFTTSTLKKYDAEVKNIESIIRRNINRLFEANFIKIESSFQQSKRQYEPLKVDIAKGNEYFLKMAKENPWLVILPNKERSLANPLLYKPGENSELISRAKEEPANEVKKITESIKQFTEETALGQNNGQDINNTTSIRNNDAKNIIVVNKLLIVITIVAIIWAIISMCKIFSP